MAGMAITLEDVLAITYTSGHAWMPDGRRIACLYDDGGEISLRSVEVSTGSVDVISGAGGPVTAFDVAASGRLAYVQDGQVWVRRPDGAAERVLARTEAASAVSWDPGGDLLAAVVGGRIWLIDLAVPFLQELDLPGRVPVLDHEPVLAWAPDGSAIAYVFEEGGRWDLGVVDRLGRPRWRSRTDNLELPFAWVGPTRLLFARPNVASTLREWVLLDLTEGTTRVLLSEDEPRGLGAHFRPQGLPDGRRAVLILRPEGWWHLYVIDTETGDLRPLTGGTGEDVGHAYDPPRVSPDGREVVFASNQREPGQRHLFAVDVETGNIRLLVGAAGTSVEAEWSPDAAWILFKHSTVEHAPELWVVGRDGQQMRRILGAMPPGIAQERLVRPQFASFRTADGWDIPNYLLVPPDAAEREPAPALVYVHGGGMRQMRDGFPPLKAYAFFYAVSLWLAELGVVSLLVNYRGGIGYGKRFEQGNYGGLATAECADVVEAGDFLRTLPYVDPARVGVWGISYGGWLTLASLFKTPGSFALGINVAGIYDFDQWMAWARTAYRPTWDHFIGRAGFPETSPEVWHNASPRHWIRHLQDPLINLHGTADRAVPFDQLDLLVQDCVAHGKDHTTHYYPGESHLFTHRATWRDALGRIEAALREQFGIPGERGTASRSPTIRQHAAKPKRERSRK